MTFSEIEEILGAAKVAAVTRAVERCYVAAGSSPDLNATRAVQQLLVCMLASVIAPGKSEAQAQDCLKALLATVAALDSDLQQVDR